MTNACKKKASCDGVAVMERRTVRAQHDGFRFTKMNQKRDNTPPASKLSISLRVKVDPYNWNCPAGNTTNLLHIITNDGMINSLPKLHTIDFKGESHMLADEKSYLNKIRIFFQSVGYCIFPLPVGMH